MLKSLSKERKLLLSVYSDSDSREELTKYLQTEYNTPTTGSKVDVHRTWISYIILGSEIDFYKHLFFSFFF
jgi:hypothetical protein